MYNLAHEHFGYAQMPATLIQITDCHLTRSEEVLRRVNTLKSFHSVLKLIKSETQQISLVMGTGDISQDGSVESYRAYVKGVNTLGAPYCWLPGNHDRAGVMSSQSDAKLVAEKSIGLGNWRLLMLDSHVEDKVHGHLSESELRFVEQELTSCRESFVLLALHHHVLPVHSAWIDELGVKNSHDFLQRVNQTDKVRGVVYGHVHQEVEQFENGIRFLGSPSSCFQFKPRSSEVSLDDKMPGYRWIILDDDGSIDTGVSRISDYGY